MQFGKLEDVSKVDFSLPKVSDSSLEQLATLDDTELQVSVGYTSWNRQRLKGFYPRGTKDELTYYSQQFNSIEFNTTHYIHYAEEKIRAWKEKTPSDFVFFPKVHKYVSHSKRLIDFQEPIDRFYDSVCHFEEQLGTCFLQVPEAFSFKYFHRLELLAPFLAERPKTAIELRNADWYNEQANFKAVQQLFTTYNVPWVIVDTPGRRDLLTAELTSDELFLRFVCAGTSVDIDRLDAWVDRIEVLVKAGLRNVNCFIHQHIETKETPILAGYFAQELSNRLGITVRGPQWNNHLER